MFSFLTWVANNTPLLLPFFFPSPFFFGVFIACHKLNPSGGHGAVTALHDAIALANLLYAMPTSTSADITNIFQEYQKERYPAVMESYNNSRFVAKVSDRGIIGRIILYLITHMPMWLWRLAVSSLVLILQEQIMHWQKEFLIYEENFF